MTIPAHLASGGHDPLHTDTNGVTTVLNATPVMPSGLGRQVSQDNVSVSNYQSARHILAGFSSLVRLYNNHDERSGLLEILETFNASSKNTISASLSVLHVNSSP